MELKSTVVTLNNLLMLNFDEEFSNFIMPPKAKLSIPNYQREYKWEKAKIKTFVDNVMQRSKFLGIVTTEVSNEEHMAIVDGQQRLTTIMLMLAQLYNACADEGETETQIEIQELISYQKPEGTFFRLKNESVGEYLKFYADENDLNRIEIEIDPLKDIYKQESKFKEAWGIIQKALDDRDCTITLDTYKQRLVDCEMLFFAQKNPANLQQGSSEEIYIDINEKAQRLDPEDIFKGHCFALCKTFAQQDQVKQLWRSIKQKFFSMDRIFTKPDMGVFLHFFLLTEEATLTPRKDVKKDLTIDGENVIVHRYNTPTKAINLLKTLELFQSNLMDFSGSLSVIDHNFPQIMTTDAQTLGNSAAQLREANIMLQDIIQCNQNMFKFPLFYFIDFYYKKEQAEKLTYDQFSNFTYMYYFYMFLFSRIGGSQKRDNLPNKVILKISSGQDYLIQFISDIIDYAGDFVLENRRIDDDITRKQLYNILDKFKITSTTTPAMQDNNLSLKLRLFPETYNLEHLVINKSHTIQWRSSGGSEYDFSNTDFNGFQAWNRQNNKWANYIWVDETFNRDNLKNKDIINKIILLRGSAVAATPPAEGTYAKKNCHIETICQHIMETEGFSPLMTAYSNNDSRANVLNSYRDFIEKYFNDENVDALRAKFETQFQEILDNLKILAQ